MSYDTILEQALKLSIDDRSVLAHELWQSVEDESAATGLTDVQRIDLEGRLEDARRNPDNETPWEVVKARLPFHRPKPRSGGSV